MIEGLWQAKLNPRYLEYLNFHKDLYERAQTLPNEAFYNSGMAVYDKVHGVLFDPDKIPFEKLAKDAFFATMGYLSRLIHPRGLK